MEIKCSEHFKIMIKSSLESIKNSSKCPKFLSYLKFDLNSILAFLNNFYYKSLYLRNKYNNLFHIF